MALFRKNLFDVLDTLSYSAILTLWAVNLLFFATAFTIITYTGVGGLSEVTPDMPLLERFGTSLYYSVITATNTGYGDILPLGAARFFAACEAFLGLFLFALFMSKLVSRRQDIVMRQMHKISFDNSFHNIREDLHTVRKDFRHIMEDIQAGQSFSHRHAKVLSVAYELCANLLYEVPTFYSDESGLYSIDPYREWLLLEAFHRTLIRLRDTLTFFDTHHVLWRDDTVGLAHFHAMLEHLKQTVPLWRKNSGRENDVLFEEIEIVGEQLSLNFLEIVV